MGALGISRHARTRMAQRGLREADIDLILRLGSEVEGGILVRRKDFERYAAGLRDQLRRAERLVGKRLVMADDTLVTAYHSSGTDTKRLLQN
ncbi:hypothetical protein GCM10010923_03720 [Blastomonas marina]|uniref:DUF4258 domain-containing protein n=1 Tax=Blastomonas marina TaxID=1867408 RepID=A0ABQ1F4G2_9SPHN|nr:DUF4258 domain-containing protein [Blastomonas marina]GFZ98752.1 hypothetical protein GCM10010923_03720 [Blastomonas marina]